MTLCVPTAAKMLAPKSALLFWLFHALLLLAAGIVRLASPALILTPIEIMRAGNLAPTNVCAVVDERLLAIARTAPDDAPTFHARVAILNGYLQGVLLRIPRDHPAFPEDFVSHLQKLQRLCAKQDSGMSAGERQLDFVTQRTRFRTLERRLPKPLPPRYLHLARAATGLLEGTGAPAVLVHRAVRCVITGKLSPQTLLHPKDWRREGVFFAFFVFYGSLPAIYLFAWLAARTNRPAWAAPGLVGVVYGTGHLLFAVISLMF